MRVLVTTYYYLPHVGGGTWYLYHVSRGLARRGSEVALLAPRVDVSLSLPGVQDPPEHRLTVYRLNAGQLPRWIGVFAAAALLLRPRWLALASRSDVIIGQFHPHHAVAAATLLMGKLVARPVVLRAEDWRRWMYGEDPSTRTAIEWFLGGVINTLNEWAARHASLILVVDKDAEAHFREVTDSVVRIEVSPNGVDLEMLDRLPGKAEIRKSLGLPEGVPVIEFSGRFTGPEYRLDVLLDAFEVVHQLRGNAVLVLIGDELPSDLRSRHSGLLTTGSLRVVGPVSQPTALAYCAAADVAIGPLGPTRTLPLKVVEALAAGTPVIVGKGSLSAPLEYSGTWIAEVPPDSQSVAQALLTELESRASSTSSRGQIPARYGWAAISESVDRSLQALVSHRAEVNHYES